MINFMEYIFDDELFEHGFDEEEAVDEVLEDMDKEELVKVIKELVTTDILVCEFFDRIKDNEEDKARDEFLKEKK